MKSKDIAELNLWWKFGKDFTEHDPDLKKTTPKRVKFKRQKIDLKTGNIFIIRGPRQVGKTVWIKQTIEDLIKDGIDEKSIFYLSCDKLTGTTRKELSSALNFYLTTIGADRKPVYIFLDEITAVSNWNIELKSLADSGTIEKCAIIVTGSNPWKIKEKKERLPGRGVEGNEMIFSPFSFREFIIQLKSLPNWGLIEDKRLEDSLRNLLSKISEIKATLEDKDSVIEAVRKLLPYHNELEYLFQIYLKTGGFPDSINSYLGNRYAYKKEIIDDNVYERFAQIVRGDLFEMVRNESNLREIIDALLHRHSSKYSFTNIAEQVSSRPDDKTIASYIDLLRESILARVFYSYDFSRKKFRPKADKKVYFYDPFLYYAMSSWLQGKPGYEICSQIVIEDETVSGILEGIIGNHLALTKEYLPMRDMITFLWFYYDKHKEIDFIYKKDNDKYLAVEVKYQTNVSEKDMSIIDVPNEYILITKETTNLKDILMLPACIFLALLEKSKGHL